MTAARKMRIGLSIRYLGYHAAAWRGEDFVDLVVSEWSYTNSWGR